MACGLSCQICGESFQAFEKFCSSCGASNKNAKQVQGLVDYLGHWVLTLMLFLSALTLLSSFETWKLFRKMNGMLV